MSTHESTVRNRRWVTPVTALVIGLGYLVAGVLGDNLEFGVFGLVLMVVVGGAFWLIGTRSETVAGLLDRRDERINAIDASASLFAGMTTTGRRAGRVHGRDRARPGRHAVRRAGRGRGRGLRRRPGLGPTAALSDQPVSSSERTTRRPTESRARSAPSSAQISCKRVGGPATPAPRRRSSHAATRAAASVVGRRAGQRLGGQLGVDRVQVVAQRGARHRLPAVGARQREDPVHQGRQPEPLAEREVHARHLERVDAVARRRSRRCP